MAKKKIRIEPREGKPSSCIVCGGALHRKSEYYCSKACAQRYGAGKSDDKPPFLSKWKIRKRKALEDPFARTRDKIRNKTRALIKAGRIRKRPCIVCGGKEVIAHHEDYNNPYKVIWICEKHHKEYHEGKIALFNGTLKWNPKKLTQIRGKNNQPPKKYAILEKNYNRNCDDHRQENSLKL
jgi:hypothetical protein